MNTVVISECFGPTIQGEGALTGRPTVFVRTGGCDSRCSWCDTLYAVLPAYKDQWRRMTTEEVFAEIQRLSRAPILVTLSGGNPALQPLGDLLGLGHAHGYTFALETQGTVSRPWFSELDFLTLSPKPPSSGMEMYWDRLRLCIEAANSHPVTVLKVVVMTDADYAFAREVALRHPSLPMYLQAGNETPPHVGPFDGARVLAKVRWLIERVIADGWNEVVVLPQFHTLLWANERGK